MALLTVDGVDVATWKAAVSKKPNWLALPAIAGDELQLGSGLGAAFGDPMTGSRPLSFSLLFRGTSESDLGDQLALATQALYRRDVLLIQSIRASKQIGFRCTEVAEKQVTGRDVMRSVELTFIGKCQDPRWRATSSSGPTGVSTTPVAIDPGTASVDDWVATFHGASTDAEVTIKNGAGATLAVFGWVGSLGGGESLVADAGTWMTKKGASLAPMATWFGDYPILDPKDAPTIQINSGTLDLALYKADWSY